MASTTTTMSIPISITPTLDWVPLPIEGNIPPPYRTAKFGLEVIPLHPTFACELKGVQWSEPISPELYAEIREVSDKVGSFTVARGCWTLTELA